jgi:polysaccharide export outer membrane protein
MLNFSRAIGVPVCVGLLVVSGARAGLRAQAPAPPTTAGATSTADESRELVPPADYTIGPGDVLSVVFWRDPDMSSEVTVRPDGMITLPLLNDIRASGLGIEELRLKITDAAKALVEGPTVIVNVLEIKSRNVFITGLVARPAQYPLSGPMRVLQLISLAGGLQEWADKKNIRIIRQDGPNQVAFRFNYDDVTKGRNLQQNIELKPGDTVVVD